MLSYIFFLPDPHFQKAIPTCFDQDTSLQDGPIQNSAIEAEKEEEVLESLQDLRSSFVDVVTIGQYLQPSKKHLPVHSFITPDVFKKYETFALDLGFKHVESGPLVRSSYKAHKHIA